MANKKLIEVALPLEAINTASAREKSIRYGHPSTLHLWWSRKPTAAARAVIFASLVDDPSSHPEQFSSEEEQNAERQRLFKILEDLVLWENSNNQELLETAKAEIMKSTNNNPPALLDPFAGGGTIPLEAQRLGLEAHAHDLNPVAVMINKAMIEIPPKFAGLAPMNPDAKISHIVEGWSGTQGLAEDVQYYGNWMKNEAFKRIGHLYPKIKVPDEQGGGEATVIAWIWARTIKCPNPACGCKMPLANSFDLSKKKGKEAWIHPEYNSERKEISYHVRLGKNIENISAKVARGANFKCIVCGEATTPEYIKREACEGRMGSQLMAVIAEGGKGRIYISPDEEQRIAAIVDKPELVPNGCLPEDPRNIWCVNYGLDTYDKLFTNRQLVVLTTFDSLVREVQERVTKDAVSAGMLNDNICLADGGCNAKAYGEAIGVYLAFAIDREVNYSSSLNVWGGDFIVQTFGRQALPMVWGFAESNPFSNSTGNWTGAVNWIVRAIQKFPVGESGKAEQFDAQSDCGMRNVMISTDPPYYDNIGYADLSDYFYIWLRENLKDIYPSLFKTMLVPKAEELVAIPYRFGGDSKKAKKFFESGMFNACQQLWKCTSDNLPITIYYAFKQNDTEVTKNGIQTASSGWETMLSAIVNAGFVITGTWPMHTERETGFKASVNALASSIVLVCRKRLDGATICTRRNFIKELKSELKPALKKLQQSNIAPVDLAQSAIGPGMAVYSRYKQVLEADGTLMTVRSALHIINQELDIFFNEQDGELDRESRFCVDLYTQYAFNDIKFGDADTLARAKNTSVATLASFDILYAQKGVVHLFGREEMSDKALNNDSIIWLLTQKLTKTMETGGIEACAQIVAPILGSNAEYAKSLAYRLYTIAERKGWAQEAYAYNSLVIAWSDIQTRAAQIQAYEPEQLDLFSFINTKEENDG